jgi:hypothetical protein
LEKRKLYGVWQAKSRGQYDPTAFDGRFPAVVICSRLHDLDQGISEEKLRSIVPFDDRLPPYEISYEQSQRLIDELLSENNKSDAYEPRETTVAGRYLADDGHLVRSMSEIIIDNWLFNHNIVHAYEHRVQVGSNYLRCDFFIPRKHVYIEFWGMIGDSKYDKRRKKKKEIYSQAGIKPLELFPMDIPVLSEVLLAKLANFNVSVV